MLGKIIDGNLTYPSHRIVLNGMQIFNPTEEQLISAEYKPIIETPHARRSGSRRTALRSTVYGFRGFHHPELGAGGR